MMRRLIVCFIGCLLASVASAQANDLTATDITVETRLDAFGLEERVIVGELVNNGTTAYADLNIYGDLLNADGDVIGEAFGFVVDQCGAAILDVPLQPGQAQRFIATIDSTSDDAIAEVDLFAEGVPTDPEPVPDDLALEGVTPISQREVVLVQWEDDTTLRYGVGCDEDVFTTYDWYRHDLSADETTALDAHPEADRVTDLFIRQTGINRITQNREIDETLFNRSFLTFPTQSRRVVFQNDIHTILTAERDGSFGRVIHSNLSRFSLQGFVWSPIGNFLAYYYGAYGEPVRYFTAGPTNGLISAFLQNNTPSNTVPGLYNDGRRVIISGTFSVAGEDVTGYYLSSPISQRRDLMFEVDELAGNNYPAPAYYRRDASTRFVYIVRPSDGQATLQCFHIEGDDLHTLTDLPLQLATDERSRSYLAPDFNTLAIAANGDHGGLWLVDLTQFDVCR